MSNLIGTITTNTQVITGVVQEVGRQGYDAYEVALLDPINPFVGTKEEWRASLKGEQGDPVPVANTLGQSEVIAVSQKLLTDTVVVMQADNTTAVTEAGRLNSLSQAAATEATIQAGLSEASKVESERQAGLSNDAAIAADQSAQSAGQSAYNAGLSEDEATRQAGLSDGFATTASQQAGLASGYAAAASVSETQADLYAGEALNQAALADTARQLAQAGATTATTQAGLADDARVLAQTAATTATTQAGLAEGYKNAAGVSAQEAADTAAGLTASVNAQLENKVDKVAGKGLSANDYTTVEKNKLGGIATGATANRSDADTDALLANKVSTGDARLSDAREWTAATIPQAEAEGGSATTRRAWSSQRVKQAFTSFFGAISSSLGRTLIGRTTPALMRTDLELGTAATKNVGTAAGNVLAVGESFGLGDLSPAFAIPTSLSWNANFGANAVVVNDPDAPYGNFLLMREEAALVGSNDGSSAWSAFLYHDKNLLNIGTTAATARAALDLPAVGDDWIDLRPYLAEGFYWNPSRDGRNSIPRGRLLPCGRIELQGAINHNEASGPLVNGVILNLPQVLRPKYTSGHIVFGDSATPLAFYSVQLLVTGEVEYAPPRVHGDIAAIFSVAAPQVEVTEAVIALNGIIMYKE